MKGRMQKIPMSIDSRPQKDSTECESYEGVQTFMDMTENNLKEVQFERGNLLEFILSPDNLNRAYLQVKRNHGSGGVDGLSTEELGGYLEEHKDELMESLKSGRYRPNPVLRVEIPKDNGRKRPIALLYKIFLSHPNDMTDIFYNPISCPKYYYNFYLFH